MAQRKLMAVRIDTARCVGSGMCVGTYPEIFEMQADGHARCVSPMPDEAAVRDAEELCPVSAVTLVYEEQP